MNIKGNMMSYSPIQQRKNLLKIKEEQPRKKVKRRFQTLMYLVFWRIIY
jgi:hypothetical protein